MMMVVDTNVPIVANRRAPQASFECVRTCVKRLTDLMKSQSDTLVLDQQWLILKEYVANLRSCGQPGVGDAFLEWTLTNRCNPQRCALVKITPLPGSDTDFEEFPKDARLSTFDPSDRKFVAASAAHSQRPPILQAVDPDWWELRQVLLENGVNVEFLCKSDVSRLAQRRQP